jgi:hypothetical protein
MSCPHSAEEAKRMWNKACNFHRRTDISHECGNPSACTRTMREAELMEKAWTSFQREMC